MTSTVMTGMVMMVCCGADDGSAGADGGGGNGTSSVPGLTMGNALKVSCFRQDMTKLGVQCAGSCGDDRGEISGNGTDDDDDNNNKKIIVIIIIMMMIIIITII